MHVHCSGVIKMYCRAPACHAGQHVINSVYLLQTSRTGLNGYDVMTILKGNNNNTIPNIKCLTCFEYYLISKKSINMT